MRVLVAALENISLVVDLNSTDKKFATKQDRQTLQNSDEKQYCHSYTAQHTILPCCYCIDKSLDQWFSNGSHLAH